ncbi:endoplasmic reticulum-Golgi intermediate compartment protein 3-like isoform X2 [Dinothrombium tinctorium]|uniref:Endoplasmic reticulum-Golgi intermediate compartment protein 3 n=1 Tax=Dinothrombium tinctorium TaxID=1965070 RepID=A0A3S4RAZ6_9ACAR|nr:endoplasmic reticulum-Golgi intermediate compartment protein 3-like isoform X2 [Dinothrombium tinctorium]
MLISDSLLDKIRRFDAYPKTLEDFRVKTYGGASVTIISGIIIIALFVSELSYYLTPEVNEELLVDVSKGEKLRINVDIVFPKLSCPFLSVDAIDVSGEQHINIVNNIYKRRLNEKGEPIQDPEKDEHVGKKEAKEAKERFIKAINQEKLNPNRCESCYGAESEKWRCCNTCEDVRAAYNDKGWALKDLNSIVQCKREGLSKSITEFDKEGCQIFGFVEVSRVGGNFHIAPGRSLTKHHVHVHDLSPHDSSQMNVTHKIRHLSFGRNIPGKTNPMDGTYQVAEEGSMMFQYYIKIVPTLFVRSDGSSLQTNQFAVTRHKKQTQESLSDSGLPGVFFIYEFAPIMVKYTERQKSFMHFATSVCAIIGGVFTGCLNILQLMLFSEEEVFKHCACRMPPKGSPCLFAGMIDSMIYHSVRAIKKKIELGKVS